MRMLQRMAALMLAIVLALTTLPALAAKAFQPGIATLGSGLRLYSSASLSGSYHETQGKGIGYAGDMTDDGKALRITLNANGNLLTAWVKHADVRLLKPGQSDRYLANGVEDSAEVRVYKGYQLAMIRVKMAEAPATQAPTAVPVTEAPATAVPATATPVPVTEAPATAVPATATPVPVTEAPATAVPAPTAAPVTEAPVATAVPATAPPAATQAPVDDEIFSDEIFTDEFYPDETVMPEPDPTFEPEDLPSVDRLVQFRSLDAPSGMKASHNRLGELTLTWNGTATAEAYVIQHKASGTDEYVDFAMTTETTYKTTALDPTVVYYLRVKAVELSDAGDVINQSPPSGSIPYIVLGDAKIDDPRGKDPTTIRLTWKAVEGANLYDVMMSVHGKDEWSTVRTDLVTDYCDVTNLSFNETYDFRVVPKRKLDNGTLLVGNTSRVTMVGSPMETPSFTNYEYTDTGVKLTWEEIPGATGYVIYRRAFTDEVTDYKKLVVLDKPVTTYVDETMEPSMVYYYFVYSFRLCEPEGWRCFSLKGNIGMGIWLPKATGLTGTSLTVGGTQLSWNAVDGATHYDVHLSSVQDAEPAAKARMDKPTGAHSTAAIGKPYYYRVRPVRIFSNGDVSIGPWSDEYTFTREAVTPTYRALLIGNTYPDQDNYLPGCDNDVDGMAAMLSRMTATPYSITKQKNITDMGMISAIQSTFAGATANDVSLFYYSGHGANAAETPNYHGSLVGVRGTFMSITRLKSELDKIPGRKVVILDSCHSGNMIGKSSSNNVSPSAFNSLVINTFASGSQQIDRAVDVVLTDADEQFISMDAVATLPRGENDLANSGYYVITAAHSTEESVSSGLDANGDGQVDKYFGLFTYGLTYGSGWNMGKNVATSLYADSNQNGQISLYEAYRYAKAAAQQQNPGQTAQIWPANSGFVIWAQK